MRTNIVIGFLVATMLVCAWMFRWQFVGVPSGGGVSNFFLVDRWTGTVRVINTGSWRIIEDAKPSTFVDFDKPKP